MTWLSKEEKKKRINKIRQFYGDRSRVELISKVYSNCPDCDYDPVKQESKDSACPTCLGKGRVSIDTTINLLAKIRWVDATEEELLKTGYLPRGGVTFTVDNIYESTIEDAEEIRIDGKEVRIKGKKYKGNPIVNRVTFFSEPIGGE